MRSFIRSRLSAYLAGALIAGLFAFTAPVAAQAQDQSQPAPAENSSVDASQAPRGFIAQPASPVNVGNPSAAAGPEQRIALVIGNSNYRNVAQLPNPANDARSIAQLLNSAGFEVIQATDLGHDEMIDVLRSFSAKIADKGPNSVAFVYYAGHGVQIDGDNYLVPVDAKISDEDDLPAAAIRLVDVMATLQAVPSRMRIVVVDACRNNPFANLREATRGLAIVDAPNGSIVGYSTAPGTEALDGQGANSPYTGAFLKLARQPNVPIEQFFKNVRLEVNQETSGRQTPWESSSLTSNFTFFGDTVQAASQRPVREAYASANLRTRGARDGYRYALATDTVQGYQDYIALYPTDPYCDHIRALLAAKLLALAWHEAVLANSAVAYQNFYSLYPNSPYAKFALKLQAQPKVLPLYQTTNNFAPPHFGSQVKFTNLNQIGQGNLGAGNQSSGTQGIGGQTFGNVLNKGGLPINVGQGNNAPLNPNLGIKTGNLTGGNQTAGTAPVKPNAPGVDLAKTDGSKIDGGRLGIKVGSVLTNNDRVTTLPTGGSSKVDTKIDTKPANGVTIRQPTGQVNGQGNPVLKTTNGSLGRGDRVLLNNKGGSNLKPVNNNNGQSFRPVAKVITPNTMVMKTNNSNASMQFRQTNTSSRTFGGSGGNGMMRSFH